jgi:hypothetical protein
LDRKDPLEISGGKGIDSKSKELQIRWDISEGKESTCAAESITGHLLVVLVLHMVRES